MWAKSMIKHSQTSCRFHHQATPSALLLIWAWLWAGGVVRVLGGCQ